MYCTKCGKQISDDSKFCDGCGNPVGGAVEPVVPDSNPEAHAAQASASNAMPEAQPFPQTDATVPTANVTAQETVLLPTKKKHTKFKDLPPKEKKKRILICAACLLLALILIFTDVFGGTGGSKTVAVKESVNDTGMVFDITRDAFSDKFNQNIRKIAKQAAEEEGVKSNPFWDSFDLNQYWNNLVEPQVDEEGSGCEFIRYFAFVLNKYNVSTKFFGNDLGSVDICFDYDENDICNVFACAAIMTFSGMGCDESDALLSTIREGIMDNTMVYKDGVLYTIIPSSVSYSFIAASEEFVRRLENSGNCNILYQ